MHIAGSTRLFSMKLFIHLYKRAAMAKTIILVSKRLLVVFFIGIIFHPRVEVLETNKFNTYCSGVLSKHDCPPIFYTYTEKLFSYKALFKLTIKFKNISHFLYIKR